VLKGKFASSVFHSCNAKTQKTQICVTGPQCVKMLKTNEYWYKVQWYIFLCYLYFNEYCKVMCYMLRHQMWKCSVWTCVMVLFVHSWLNMLLIIHQLLFKSGRRKKYRYKINEIAIEYCRGELFVRHEGNHKQT
jgi:membrane protein YdbS with pleckstrin-like domain